MVQDRVDFTDTSTHSETVSEGQKKTISQYKTSILAYIEDEDVEYPINNIVYDHIDAFDNFKIEFIMNNTQYNKYYMRPDLLSYDLYGSIDYEWVLLAINNIISPKDFTKKKIYIVSDEINNIVSSIINAETNYININRSQYQDPRF